jgi:hypothetical protein
MYQGEHRNNVRKQRDYRQRPEIKTQVDHQRNCQIVNRNGCQEEDQLRNSGAVNRIEQDGNH